MGWLRHLMGEAQPPIGSFDALAGRLIGHPDWPRDSRTQLRSLGALLSKLDRGTDLEWLADRTQVQHIAAEVLGCPLSSIQEGLGVRLQDADRQLRRMRFDEVRFARPLQLLEEPLPPGFPSAVQHPGAWQRLWWYAPPGSGRGLLGQWLKARGLARVEVVSDATQAQQLLDDANSDGNEPLLVELMAEAETLSGTLQPPAHGSLCIACSELPRQPGWRVVRSPNIDSYLKALVTWLAPRLPKDGNFDADAALGWLKAQAADAPDDALLDSFGTALGLLGLIDEFGIDNLAKRPLAQVARAFVSEKLKLALSRGSSESAWLGERGFEVLVGMAERALGAGTNWQAVRSESAWLELVPEEFQRSVDQEWARLALAKAVSRSAAKELETALQRLQPGAFRIVRALRSAGLLRTQGQGLGFAPHWLSRVVQAEAFETLLDSSAFHWGEALLSPRSAPRLITALYQRFVAEDFTILEDLLELDATSNPAYAAAVEGCFRALGLALGEDCTVPGELLTALYEEQRELLVHIDRHTLPQPRIAHGDGDPRLQLGAFYLAALAISAELPERGVPKHPVLHPWAERVVDARFESVLDRVNEWLQTLGSEQETRWRRLAVGLVDRLALHASESAGKTVQPVFVDAAGEPHELEWPSLLLRELKAGALNPVWLERLQRRPEAVANIRALCGTRAEPWQQLSTQLWELWHAQGMPEGALRSWCTWGSWFWPTAPASCLLPALERSAELGLAVSFAHFTEQQWQQLRDPLPEQVSTLLASSALWAQVPLAVGWHWLHSEPGRKQLTLALPILWQRDAAWAIQEYDATAQRGATMSPALVQFLAATPLEHGAMLVPWLKTVTSKPGAAIGLVDAARQRLHRQVAQRAAGFREAYTLLDELERRGRRIVG
jgi:hypothetical protein